MIPRILLARLLAGVVLLPAAIVLVVAVAGLLAGMQDHAGAHVLIYVAIGLGLLWALGLVALLLALAANSLGEEGLAEPSPDERAGADEVDGLGSELE